MEVVQRPTSVGKELMENAVDAGATQVSVIIEDSGRTLIQVIDNGVGMSPADAVLCFERHATSKIAEPEDLSDILTYGFRGEALASIAAVSEVVLKTRRAQDETAIQVRTGGGNETKTSTVAAPVGSNFSVRNLFFNTPARRKFLKSDNIEFRHIVEEFTRVAITRPDISFTLAHNGKEIYVLNKAKSLKFRIVDLLGNSVVSDVVDLDTNAAELSIRGFVGRPATARKTPGNQFFFVNGRYFRSAYFHKAVMKAYEGLIPEGVTPAYFIFLETDPHTIDVNVHPTKTEVNFEDDTVVFQLLYACVRETLGKNSFGASIDFNTEGAVELPKFSSNFGEYLGNTAPEIGGDPEFDPFNMMPGGDAFPGGSAVSSGYKVPDNLSSHVDASQDYGQLFENRTLPASRTLTIQGKYIITPTASGVMIVNISRARERIMYDRTIRILSDAGVHFTQTALFPVEVEVGMDGALVLEGYADLLSRRCFDIRYENGGTVSVEGVPEGYSCEQGKVEVLLRELVNILSEETDSLQEIMNQRLAERIAAPSSAGADSVRSPLEAQALIDTLFASDNAEFTSNGRRIITIVSVGDIDKMF